VQDKGFYGSTVLLLASITVNRDNPLVACVLLDCTVYRAPQQQRVATHAADEHDTVRQPVISYEFGTYKTSTY